MFIHQLKRSLYKRIFGNELQSFKQYKKYFVNKIGLEIGGPSKIFSSAEIIPVYEIAAKIDGCNFSTNTVWEGQLQEGNNYEFQQNKPKGKQLICEGNDLSKIDNKKYDFLLSSHSLEHFANPLKAISEWKRVLKDNGLLIIVLPHPKFTFDNKRTVTKFSHLLDDYNNDIQENDLTHLEEVVEMHDYSMTPDIADKAFMKARSLKNFENRCLHHHVFDIALLKEIFQHFEIELMSSDFEKPFHLIVYGRVKH
jgi:SAM-dependent methyltransferase